MQDEQASASISVLHYGVGPWQGGWRLSGVRSYRVCVEDLD